MLLNEQPASPIEEAALERLRRLGGDSLVLRMIQIFMGNGAQRYQAACDGILAGDLDAVARAAHSLKSSAGNLGAQRLQHVAEQLEHGADQGDAASVVALHDELNDAFTAALARLGEERSRLEA